MNSLLKRTLSFALALIMVLSLTPVAEIHVHATEAEEPATTEPAELTAEETPTEEPAAEEPEAEEPSEEIPQEKPIETDELEIIEVTVKDTPAMAYETAEKDLEGTLSVKGLIAKWQYNSNVSDGEASWIIKDGNTIVGTTKGGTTIKTNKSTLTLTNNLGSKATLKFSYSLAPQDLDKVQYGKVTGVITVDTNTTKIGTCEVELESGTSTTITFESVRSAYTNTLTLSNISLTSVEATDNTVTFTPGENGSYTVDNTAITEEKTEDIAPGTNLVLEATAADGYQFFGWYDGEKYLNFGAKFTFIPTSDTTITPVFIKDTIAVFAVGDEHFDDLTEAGAAAAAGTEKTIVLLNDGTVTGSHTIPTGTTLLIPHKDDQKEAYGAPAADAMELSNCVNTGLNTHVAWEEPSKYRELTLAEDAIITVNGEIEVSGMHAAAGGGDHGHGGSPTGKLGYIKMEKDSNITLNSGATLLCWGYIYGDGTVIAKSGSSVYENFQIMDFRGGNVTLGLATFEKTPVFPLSQYYVQNVEVATTFEAGSAEYIATSLFAQERCLGAAVKFIGDGAMFQPATGSKVVKEYDPVNDELNMTTYGNCALAPLSIEIAGITGGNNESGDAAGINSANFVLPITNNINITVKTGTATLKQSIMMLPGSSLTVDEGATLAIADGYQLQVFDSENWTTGYPITFGQDLDGDDTMDFGEMESNLKFCYPNAHFAPISYSPTKEKIRTTDDLTDVTVDINGTIITNGFMYSTVMFNIDVESGIPSIGGGANIVSTKQTGTLVMNSGAGTMPATFLYDQSKKSTSEIVSFGGVFYMIPMMSVQLKNGDDTMLDTTGAEAGTTYKYCKRHDHWAVGECTLTTCEITWIGADGTALGTQEFAIGVTPDYTGETPVKDGFTFAGWSTKANGEGDKYPIGTDLPKVTADATYFAYFSENTVGLKGDVDLDGAVKAADATALARHLAKIQVITDSQALENADTNSDGVVGAADATLLARYLAKIITDWNQK